jgi:hypothetical protein
MKSLFVILTFVIATFNLHAQTRIEKSFAVQPDQKIFMHFDYPKLIKVTTWQSNEILVQGSVTINNGENDESFELSVASEGKRISVSNTIKDFDRLPRRITVVENGQKLSFKSKAEYKAYAKGKPRQYEMYSENVDMEIELSIKVPANTETHIESIYGMVEVTSFNGALTVNATYGGTDVAIQQESVGQLTASTNYGEIFSNLTSKFDNNQVYEENFHTEVSTKLGKGPTYKLESQYGNVYLRRATSN